MQSSLRSPWQRCLARGFFCVWVAKPIHNTSSGMLSQNSIIKSVRAQQAQGCEGTGIQTVSRVVTQAAPMVPSGSRLERQAARQ